MKALLRLSPIFVLALAQAACGDDETELPDFATLFPADNEIGSYVEDPDCEFKKAEDPDGPYFSTDGGVIQGRIDGAAADFIAAGFVNFGLDAYTNGTYGIDLFIWQMKTPDGAATAMNGASTGTQWHDVSLGDAGVYENQAMSWKWFIRKGVYVIELSSTHPDDDTAQHATAKTEGETFAAAILGKMP